MQIAGWRAGARATVVAAAFAASPASADHASDVKACFSDGLRSAERITVCTRVINAGRLKKQDLAGAYNWRGEAHRMLNEYDLALVDYARALDLKPSVYAFANRAETYRNQGKYDLAIADTTKGINLDAAYTAAYAIRGLAYEAVDNVVAAKTDFNKALTLKPKGKDAAWSQEQARTHLAAIARKAGNCDEAIGYYDDAIRINPRLAAAYNGRGLCYKAKGDLERAIADYSQAITNDSNYAWAYNNRALAYRENGDLDRAIADHGEAIANDPKYDYAFYSRGNAFESKGDHNSAMADFSEAIRLDPKYSSAYFARGRANLYLGALPNALADINQAAELNPSYAYSALWLDIVSKRSKLPSRLADASKQIDMTRWPAPVIRLYLGQLTPEAMFAAADDPNAKTRKEQVCEANFYAGELALQNRAKDDALRMFRAAVADCPKTFLEYDGALAELKIADEGK